jgi:hypothetical protein
MHPVLGWEFQVISSALCVVVSTCIAFVLWTAESIREIEANCCVNGVSHNAIVTWLLLILTWGMEK